MAGGQTEPGSRGEKMRSCWLVMVLVVMVGSQAAEDGRLWEYGRTLLNRMDLRLYLTGHWKTKWASGKGALKIRG